MAAQYVTVVLTINPEDDGCIEDVLQSIVENNDHITGFDIIDVQDVTSENIG